MQEHMMQIDRYPNASSLEDTFSKFEMKLGAMHQVMFAKSSEMLYYLDSVTDGIYAVVAKHLSPRLIDPLTMREELTGLV